MFLRTLEWGNCLSQGVKSRRAIAAAAAMALFGSRMHSVALHDELLAELGRVLRDELPQMSNAHPDRFADRAVDLLQLLLVVGRELCELGAVSEEVVQRLEEKLHPIVARCRSGFPVGVVRWHVAEDGTHRRPEGVEPMSAPTIHKTPP